MKKYAEKELSESIVASISVGPRGFFNRTAMKGAAGSIGGLAGAALDRVTSKQNATIEKTPNGYNKAMYLAVTPTRVAFFRIKPGLAAGLDSLIAEYSRSEIKTFFVGRGKMQIPLLLTRPIDIETKDHGLLLLETLTPLFFPGTVKKLAQELQTSLKFRQK